MTGRLERIAVELRRRLALRLLPVDERFGLGLLDTQAETIAAQAREIDGKNRRLDRMLLDAIRSRERLFEALGGDEDDQDVPTMLALLDVAEARLEKLRRLEALLGALGAPDLEHLVDEHRAAVAELARLRSTARAISPRWEYVARAVPHLEEIVKSEPFYVGRVDRIGARIRDQYDGLGLSITDEDVLYVSLVVLGMVVELASDGVRSEMVSPVTLRNLAAVTQTYAAALIPYLPEEAKGR